MNETERYQPDESGYLTEEDTKSYYSRIGLFCFCIGAISFAISFAVSLVIKLLCPSILKDAQMISIIDYVLSFVAIYCIATPIANLALKPLPTAVPKEKEMRFKNIFGTFCICFAAMMTGSYFSSFITTFIESITGKTLINPVEASLSSSNLILSILCVGIIFPILEELLFRKLLCSKLLPLGEKQTIVISAAIFGLIHGNLFQFAYAFLLGLVFGYVYVKSGKLIYTIIFHCIINLFSGVFAQYVLSQISLEKIEEYLEWIIENPAAMYDFTALTEKLGGDALGFFLYLLYTNILTGFAVAGTIIFMISYFKRRIALKEGALKVKHPVSSFFLTGGVAAAVGFIVLKFLYSIWM